MRRHVGFSAALLAVTVCAAGVGTTPFDAACAAQKEPVVAFLAPAGGSGALCADEISIGLRAALTGAAAGFERVELGDDPARSFKDLAKSKPAVVVAWAPDGLTVAVEQAAEKARLPLVLVSPEPSTIDLDPKRAVFWTGGMRAELAAPQLMDFLFQPAGSRDPTLLHDGSARGRRTIELCAAFHHMEQRPKAPHVVEPAFDAAAAKALAGTGTDGILYCGGPEGAQRLLDGLAAAGVELPVVLGQGLVTRALPRFVVGEAANTWALDMVQHEDAESLGADAKLALEAALGADGGPVLPNHVRGYRTGMAVREALAAAEDASPKRLVPALRALARKSAVGKPVFDAWGHMSLVRLVAWRSPKSPRDEPPCRRLRPTELPMQGMPQIGFHTASRYSWEPDTQYVHVTFGEGAKRTIEKDLELLGLATGGYEADLEKRILDDLLGRAISRLNLLFLRNPDGTSIPGVSFAISFGTEPPDKRIKASKVWTMEIAGDDEVAGGRASGSTAWVFSTYLRRTMYQERALKPPLAAGDRPYLVGTYKWGTAVEQNLRDGALRALVDGYSQAMALTGAHELGHLAGCGHDTASPRSIMNVAEGADLDFDFAEWIPAHVEVLEGRLGRVPAKR